MTLILKSEKLKISESPKMLLRLMDDSVISLDGYMLGATNKSEGAVMIGYLAVAINQYVSEAKFPITKEQVESLSKGVKKLRLNPFLSYPFPFHFLSFKYSPSNIK